MSKFNLLTILTCAAIFLGLTACGPSLVIQNVDYTQPLESVLEPDEEGIIHDQRYAIKFSIQPVLEEEGVPRIDQVRLIRNRAGYYFITAPGFRNVYVFKPDESELKLHKTIGISGEGIEQPVFNQRDTHIQLVDRTTGQAYHLDHN